MAATRHCGEFHSAPKRRWNHFAVVRFAARRGSGPHTGPEEEPMNGIIYLVGLIVVIMFILSFLGLR
jgi:hypothetical protein